MHESMRDSGPRPLEAWLTGGGEMGRLLREKDWSQTPLGPIEQWPQSLKTTLGILLNSRYPMFVFWGPGLVKIYNDAYRPITGQKHPWALGASAPDVWPEIWSDIEPLVERALAGDATWSDNLMLVMERNGFPEEVYFTFSYSPVADESGGVGGMFCACTETTAQVLGERRLRTLRDLGPATLVATSASDVCATAARVLGGNAADVPFALVYLDDGEGGYRLCAASGIEPGSGAAPARVGQTAGPAVWPLTDAVESRTSVPVDLRSTDVAHEDGPTGPWPGSPPTRAMVWPLTDGSERPAGALVLGISSRRPFDDEYREWQQLAAAQVSAALARARVSEQDRQRAEALAALDRAKTTFFSNVSHELRTPLTLVLGPVEDALGASPPVLQGASLRAAHRNALRLLKLVNSILDLSRIEAGRLDGVYAPIDLAAFTADVAQTFRATVERVGLEFLVDCRPLSRPVFVDGQMWEKVVLNLVSNAFKHTFAGAILVELAESGEGVSLTVSDTGVGIAPEALPRLFERFHRARPTRARTHEGTGIGLALVQEIARLHGGRVAVHSVPGLGSRFEVWVPFGTAHLPPGQVHDEPGAALRPRLAPDFVDEALHWLQDVAPPTGGRQTTTPPRPTPPGRARILVVDDNADMREYVARLLASRWEIELAADGRDAWERIRRGRFDLVVADVMMPGLDGFALLRAVRQDDATRDLPVMLLSARAGEEARLEGVQAGADDYLVKPFASREMLARVAGVLEVARVRRESQDALAQLNQQLRARVTELETLLNIIPVGIGIALDRDCRTIQVNPAFAETLGLPAGVNASLTAPEHERPKTFAVYDPDGRLVAPEDLPMQVAAREGREIRELEFDVVRADDQVVRLIEYATPLFDEDGQPRGSVGTFIDITERRRGEARKQFLLTFDEAVRSRFDPLDIVAAAAERLGRHLGVSRCAYADVDPDGDTVVVPHEFTDGHQPGTLVGRWRLSDFGPSAGDQLRRGETLVVRDHTGDRASAGAAALTALSIRATVCAAEVRQQRLVALFAVHADRPRHWRDDEIRLVELVARRCWESIERARAVRAVAESEARYRGMADAMPQLVWAADASGRVTYYNARAVAYAGLAPGRSESDITRLVHPDDVDRIRSAWAAALTDGHAFAVEHRLQMRDGEWRWHLSRAQQVPGDVAASGDARWIGTSTDVHDLRVAQDALRQKEARLREQDRRKDEFLAILAHELRNPLAPLQTGLALLASYADAPEHAPRVRAMMERQVAQMVRLVDDLLDVSRITSGRVQLRRRPTRLDDVVRDALESHRHAIESAGLDMRVCLPDEPCVVAADPARLLQVLSNLVHNATKFTPRGGLITVSASRPPGPVPLVALIVRDTGIGIPAGALDRIFELFTQEHGEAGRGLPGLGIGLALARQLAELHGGQLTAESDGPGRGSRFVLTLPLVDEAPVEARLEPGQVGTGRPRRVLVVDDNADAADALAALLQGHGHATRTAYSGAGGVQAAQAFDPDVVLLDIGMPGMDGIEACRRLRAATRSPRLIVVAVTGFGQEHDRRRILESGFDAHLTKPADLEALQALLDRLVVQAS